MSQLEETDDFYAAGRKLAEHIADSTDKAVSTRTLQAVISDFLSQHEETQEALRSIVARPGFLQLAKLAGSGEGVALKCSFIDSLRKVYSANTAEAADRLASGMMGLAPKATHYDSAEQKTTVDTLSYERKPSDPEAARQDTNSSNANHPHGKVRVVCENLSRESQAHNMLSLALIVVVAFAAGCIWEAIKARVPSIDPFAPYHVRSGSQRRMPNNTGISNELLAEAILASAIYQCENHLGANGDWEASAKKYRSYIEKKSIGNRVTNSKAFHQLSASLKEVMLNSGSCEAPGGNAVAIEKVRNWLL